MLTISLLTTNNALQMDGNHLIVAAQEPFTLLLNNIDGIANGSLEISPDLTDYTVTYTSGFSAQIVFANGLASFRTLARHIFTVANTQIAGTSSQAIDISVVSRYAVKRHSAHLWNIYNFSASQSVLVEIFNMSNNESVLLRTLPANSWFTFQLPDDGMYRVQFGTGNNAKYLFIIDTSIVDKVYTDIFRKMKCCSCNTSSKLQYWWRHLNGLRDALELQMGKLSAVPVYYDLSGYTTDLDQYLKVDEIRKKLYSLAQNFLKSKCSTDCSC